MKAIIMAGGEGTRLRPLTCDCPKPMMRLMDRPVMEYALALLKRHGVAEAAATLVSAPFDWLASTMGQAAGWLIEAMWTVFDSTTLVDVTADGYLDVYNLLFGIGVFIVVLFFCFQLILGLFHHHPLRGGLGCRIDPALGSA